jgi:thiol-disulfide isomerase/thioredoxin
VSGLVRQTAIYLGGVSGIHPRVPTDATKLEGRARRSMNSDAFDYIVAGAGSEDTIAANRRAFERWRIVPRMLRDVSERDPGVELFGRRLPAPLLLAPVGVLELAHRDADRAVARAAREVGVPMVFSNQASTPMEECASILGDSPRWLQLYWSSSDELVESLVGRAEACGCEAIVLTLDTTILGWRPRDLDIAFLPFLRGKGIAQYTSDPVFQRLLEEDGAPEPGQQPKPWSTRTLDGRALTPASFAGKVAVVDFWATWCGPCKMEIPSFIKLQEKYKEKGLEIVGVSLDPITRGGNAELVGKFMQENNINYTIWLVNNPNALMRYPTGQGIPTTYVIDRNGRTVKQYVGVQPEAVFESDIKSLL